MAGMTKQRTPSAYELDRRQETSDFAVLTLDVQEVEPRIAPDPLSAAPPERLEPVRRKVRRIAAARQIAEKGAV